jgi:hypothetical protein
MTPASMRFGWVRGSPGASPELRRAALLGALLLAASCSAGRLAAATPAATGPDGGYNASGRQQLLLRRPGPKKARGKG